MNYFKFSLIGLITMLMFSGCVSTAPVSLNYEISDEIPVEAALKIINESIEKSRQTSPDQSAPGDTGAIQIKGVDYCDTLNNNTLTEYMKPLVPGWRSGEWTASYNELAAYARTCKKGHPFENKNSYYIVLNKKAEDTSYTCYVYMRMIKDNKILKMNGYRSAGTTKHVGEEEVHKEMSKVMTALKSLGVDVERSDAPTFYF